MAKEKINALVMVEEQPYSIPGNWNWFHLGALSEAMCDGVHYAPEYLNSGIPCFSAKDIFDDEIHLDKCNFISNDEYEGMKSKINIKDNSLLVTKSGSIGRTAIVEKAYPFGLVESIGVVNTKYVSAHYVKRLLDMGFVYSSEFLEQYTTGTTIKHLTLRLLANIKVPLPPEAEQQRIVDRIESLFAKLDEAKEKAQAVVDGFEDRKAAILHKAFTGELTAEWRKRNTEQKFRKKVTIREVCSSLAYGTASKSSKEGKVAVIRMGNLQGGEIDWDNLVYSNNDGDNVKYALSAGDVLFNRTNSAEHVGKTAIYRGERPAIYAGYLIKLDYDHSRIQGEYLNYLLNSPEAREYCKRVKTDAVNQSNINAQKIGAFEIPLVGMNEQEETCRLAKKMIGAEETIKDAAQNSIRQIDTMKKAILARAFRGELGTNDPTELPADIS